MYILLDRESVLSKSLTNILKKYLSRDLAMKYTTVRQMPGKTIIKGTLFFDSILGKDIFLEKNSKIKIQNVISPTILNISKIFF